MSIKKYSSGSWVTVPYRKYETATDTITSLPKTIIGDGQNISAYTIKGNMSQSGTPTPSSPICPTECGDKTANLFDVGAYSSALLTNCTIAVTNDVVTQTNTGTLARSAWKIDGLQVGTDYTMAAKITNPNQTECQIRICDSTNSSVIINSSASKATSITLSVTFTAVTSTHYIRLYSNTSSATANTYSVEFSEIMLNTGSTTLPYEPYGLYKIPILSNGTTTPVYLGQVQSERQIAKYEFTGQENWQTASGFFYLGSLSPDYLRARDTITYVCTHYTVYPQTGFGTNVPNKNIALGSDPNNQRVYVKDDDMADVTAFKSYLASQYNNGTPVTIWYVLATPTTTTLNEPIRKIGDYADSVSNPVTIPTSGTAQTFDVDTMLKPSEVSLTYHGWHEHEDTKYSNP